MDVKSWKCYEYVDASPAPLHWHTKEETGADSSKYLAMNLSMEKRYGTLRL